MLSRTGLPIGQIIMKEQKMIFRFLLAAAIAMGSTAAFAQPATWEPAYRGDDPELLYLPDTKATYWRYGWVRKPGDKTGIIIRGKTPDARYFSYNVYNDETKSSLGSITDYKLQTDDGSPNPFAGKGGDLHTGYSVVVLPQGVKTDAKNVLYFPDDLTKVSVFLRYYVAHNGYEGGTSLPEVQLFDPQTDKVNTAPSSNAVPVISSQEVQKYLVPMLERVIEEFESDPEAVARKLQSSRTGEPVDMKELIASQVVAKAFKLFRPEKTQYSYRLLTAGTYPNDDNYYLGMPVIMKEGQALLARFKAPRKPASVADYPNADVRYFSLSQGDEYSYTHGTIMDVEMKIDSDGFANFIIAKQTPEIVAKAKELGVNFMPWLAGEKVLMIYRHMLPATEFSRGIDKVKPYDPKQPAEEQVAVRTIGKYALAGELTTRDSVLAMSEFPKF